MDTKRIEAWMYSADWKTWVGHGLVGLVVAFVCHWWDVNTPAEAAVFAVAFFYGAREVPGLLASVRPFNGEMFRDNALDLMTPFIGVLVYLVLKSLTP